MNKTCVLLASIATIALAVPVFADDKDSLEIKTKITEDSKGNVAAKSTSTETDASGTTVTHEKTIDIDKAANGDSKETKVTKVVTDPKGLLNKTSEKTTEVIKVETDPKGNIDSEVKTTTVKDKAGLMNLMNKDTTTTTDTAKGNDDGSVTTVHTKDVNGKQVEGATDIIPPTQ